MHDFHRDEAIRLMYTVIFCTKKYICYRILKYIRDSVLENCLEIISNFDIQ